MREEHSALQMQYHLSLFVLSSGWPAPTQHFSAPPPLSRHGLPRSGSGQSQDNILGRGPPPLSSQLMVLDQDSASCWADTKLLPSGGGAEQ